MPANLSSTNVASPMKDTFTWKKGFKTT